MRVTVDSLQGVKDASGKHVLCHVEVQSSTAAWVPFSQLSSLLAGSTLPEEKHVLFHPNSAEEMTAVLQSVKASQLKKQAPLLEGVQEEDMVCKVDNKVAAQLTTNLLRFQSHRAKVRLLNEACVKIEKGLNFSYAFLALMFVFSRASKWLGAKVESVAKLGVVSATTVGLMMKVLHMNALKHSDTLKEAGKELSAKVGKIGEDVLSEEEDIALVSKELGKIQAMEPKAKTERSPEDLAAEVELCKLLDQLEEEDKYDEAFEKASQHNEKLLQANCEREHDFLWRYVRAYYGKSQLLKKTDKEAFKQTLSPLHEEAETFMQEHETSYLAHKWYALVRYSYMEAQGTKQSIMGAIDFYNHTKRALELEQSDSTIHFMMGKFAYGVSKLSWGERMAAKAVFGKDPPKATYEDALKCFELSVKHRPDSKATPSDLIELGRCYLQLKRNSEAKEALNKCIAAAPEEEILSEAQKLLKSC